MTFLTIKPGHIKTFTPREGALKRVHVFDEPSIGAVNAALAAQRPLLVRGEPGVGKSQLAEAAAEILERAFLPFTVDSRTESRDLLWRFDAVRRLAQAQLYGALRHKKEADLERELAVENFVLPGPLWWAFDSASAEQASSKGMNPLSQYQNDTRRQNGWVVLIDEIDKGESDVPNGLLEALGAAQFTPFGRDVPVAVTGPPPLIIITTNEERVLPDAFVRRCLVLQLVLPRGDTALEDYLTKRGKAHFGEQTNADILRKAARQLVADRQYAEAEQLRPLPGQAEYLDLIRAVVGQAPGNEERQDELIESAARFTLKKYPGASSALAEKMP